jgi:hypothetical protein
MNRYTIKAEMKVDATSSHEALQILEHRLQIATKFRLDDRDYIKSVELGRATVDKN